MIDNEKAERLKNLHEEIHREHGLISTRINWSVMSQAFLISTLAISGSANHTMPWLAMYFIPILGLVISVSSFISIIAAMVAMSGFRESEKKIAKELGVEPIQNIYIHLFGMCAAAIIPLAFIIAWVVAVFYLK
jgi:glucan phosphoethanolaminetransferase (alkaline phosphatase superfamily)